MKIYTTTDNLNDYISVALGFTHSYVLPPKITQVGPGTYGSQYTIEHAIKDFGRDIRLPSNPSVNLCQIAFQKSQINALKMICPELNPNARLHTIGDDVGDGYFLLAPHRKYPSTLNGGPE